MMVIKYYKKILISIESDPFSIVLYFFSIIFTMITLVSSFYLIYKHLKYYSKPDHQRNIIRIIFMVPFYCLLTLLIIFFKDQKRVLELIRDLYESYALYMFFQLLVLYGGGENNLKTHFILHEPLPIIDIKFFKFLSKYKYKPTEKLLFYSRIGVFQGIIIKPLFALLSIICLKYGIMGSSLFEFKTLYPYKTIFTTISISLALSSIMFFIKYSYHELIAYKPILKFLSIKIVLGVFFYQSLIFSIFQKFVKGEEHFDLLKNQLIIFELFIVSILHIYSYNYEFYRVLSMVDPLLHKIQKNSFISNVIHTINQNDVLIETYQSLKSSYKSNGSVSSSNGFSEDSFNASSIEMGDFKSSSSSISSISSNNSKNLNISILNNSNNNFYFKNNNELITDEDFLNIIEKEKNKTTNKDIIKNLNNKNNNEKINNLKR